MTGFLPDHLGAEVRVSPNFGPRAAGKMPVMVILHYTGMIDGIAAEARLTDPSSEVSSHYLVHEDGRIVQMVRESDRAWHAGRSSWRGETDINSSSIGVEIVNPGHEFGYRDFPDDQIAALIGLCVGICSRNDIDPWCILAHSDVAPGRKVDPGEKFPWHLLARSGLGHFVEPSPLRPGRGLAEGQEGPEVEKLQSMLAYYGYAVEITGFFDAGTRAVVEAFQRHFRQERVDGVVDWSTLDTLYRLLQSMSDDAA